MIRKKSDNIVENEKPDETWLIPYSDLLTLLLALFVVLSASSNLDQDKANQIQYALATAFGGAINEDDGANNATNFINDAKDMELENGGIVVSADNKQANLEIAAINLFEQGNANLRPEAMPIVRKMALLLNNTKYKKYRIVVEGHTDDTKESEVFPSNWELSGARAGAVVRAMVANSMDVNRFKAVGLAEVAPAYPNLDPYGEPIPENRMKNRRVVVRIEF